MPCAPSGTSRAPGRVRAVFPHTACSCAKPHSCAHPYASFWKAPAPPCTCRRPRRFPPLSWRCRRPGWPCRCPARSGAAGPPARRFAWPRAAPALPSGEMQSRYTAAFAGHVRSRCRNTRWWCPPAHTPPRRPFRKSTKMRRRQSQPPAHSPTAPCPSCFFPTCGRRARSASGRSSPPPAKTAERPPGFPALPAWKMRWARSAGSSCSALRWIPYTAPSA